LCGGCGPSRPLLPLLPERVLEEQSPEELIEAVAEQESLQRKIAEIKQRLMADGLLDPTRKRPLPEMPRFVGVATSLSSAALQDFLKVTRARHPGTRVLIAHCAVQGVSAASEVIRALDLLIEDGRSEVLEQALETVALLARTAGPGWRILIWHDADEALAAAPRAFARVLELLLATLFLLAISGCWFLERSLRSGG
jgi:AcrR family transcriptional regulator